MNQVKVWLQRGRCKRERELVETLVSTGHDPLEIAAVTLKMARGEEKQRSIAPISIVARPGPSDQPGSAAGTDRHAAPIAPEGVPRNRATSLMKTGWCAYTSIWAKSMASVRMTLSERLPSMRTSRGHPSARFSSRRSTPWWMCPRRWRSRCWQTPEIIASASNRSV